MLEINGPNRGNCILYFLIICHFGYLDYLNWKLRVIIGSRSFLVVSV